MATESVLPVLCECGCGEPAPIATRNRYAIGHLKGQSIRFIDGHQLRVQIAKSRERAAKEHSTFESGDGLCRCGCGQPAPLAPVTMRKRGHVRGQPQKYIKGHATTRMERSKCAASDCNVQITAEYCAKHASRIARHGNLTGKRPTGPAEERFWRRVQTSEGCWEWTGSRRGNGYGVHWTDERKLTGAHRYSYELHHGAIADSSLFVCHHCDNPPCVRPDHLFLGTVLDNARDMVAKGRQVTIRRDACPSGHPYEGNNVAINPAGHRRCRQCTAESNAKAIAKRNAESATVRCPVCSVGVGLPRVVRGRILTAAHLERHRLARRLHLEDAS